MKMMLSHTSALEVIRRWDSFRLLERGRQDEPWHVPRKTPSVSEVLSVRDRVPALESAALPLHVVVGSDSGRHQSAAVIAHLYTGDLPAEACFSLAPGVSCATPELVVLQMAEYATELELTLLIDELCGLYAIQPAARTGLVQRRDPLTSTQRIRELLERLGPIRGSAKVGRALVAARSRSGSPRESMTAHRLEMSARRGGYEIPVVSLNDSLLVERADRIVAGAEHRIRKPDIMILAPEGPARVRMAFRAVAIDYKGEYHRDPWQESRDTDRRNELLAQGVKDYEIEREHFGDLGYMDWLAEMVRRDLGLEQPRRSPRAEQTYRARRASLARELAAIDGLSWTARQNALLMEGSRLAPEHPA